MQLGRAGLGTTKCWMIGSYGPWWYLCSELVTQDEAPVLQFDLKAQFCLQVLADRYVTVSLHARQPQRVLAC